MTAEAIRDTETFGRSWRGGNVLASPRRGLQDLGLQGLGLSGFRVSGVCVSGCRGLGDSFSLRSQVKHVQNLKLRSCGGLASKNGVTL